MVQYLELDGNSDGQGTVCPKGGPQSFLSRAVGLKVSEMGFGWGTSVGKSGGGTIISIPQLCRTQ